MTFVTIRDLITGAHPDLARQDYWDLIESALVIRFTERNSGDLDISVRRALGLNPRAHKTHIDVTSGGDVPVGWSPVIDFLDADFLIKKVEYPARMYRENLVANGAHLPPGGRWIDSSIHVKFFGRNEDANPSAQLLERGDLLPLRQALTLGSVLILLKRSNGTFDTFGLRDVAALDAVMGKKTKRMFLSPVVSDLPPRVEVAETVELAPAVKATKTRTSRRVARAGRATDPALQKAVELQGMASTRAHLSALGFVVLDVHTADRARGAGLDDYPGFDQLAQKNGTKLCIEIKGTITQGEIVELTYNELQAVVKNDDCILAVVSNIVVEKRDDGSYLGAGGEVKFYRWLRRDAVKVVLESVDTMRSHAEKEGLAIPLAAMKFAVTIDEDKLSPFNINA